MSQRRQYLSATVALLPYATLIFYHCDASAKWLRRHRHVLSHLPHSITEDPLLLMMWKVEVKAAYARARARTHAHADAVHDADADADADAGADAGAYAHGRAYVHASFPRFCHYPSLHTDKKPHETLPRTQHVGPHVRRCGSANFTLYDSHASFWKMDGESSRGLWP